MGTGVCLCSRVGEPPIVRPGNLLLGNAADFARDAISFLHNTERRHGNVFTLRLINQYITIVMDPHSYTSLSNERNFDFDPIQKQVTFGGSSFWVTLLVTDRLLIA